MKVYSGWTTLAAQFPPSVNTDGDPTKLKPFESPACYGVDCKSIDRLKTGSIPTGTARTATTKTVGSRSWLWYYNRLWSAPASSSVLYVGAPEYDDVYIRQGIGGYNAEANIITFMPALGDSMWIATASGSHIIQSCPDPRGFFLRTAFSQEMYAAAAVNCLTLDNIPIVSNASGVFQWNGTELKELTRPVRENLGSFAAATITADYQRGFVIGASKFVVDTQTGKLFDYGTTGFLFTTRTLASADLTPFTVDAVAFVIEHSDTSSGTIAWQSKVEEGDWVTQPSVECKYMQGVYSRVEQQFCSQPRTGRRVALRLTDLSSNISIRSIELCVQGYAQGAFSE